MTKTELDSKAREILDSVIPSSRRNNKILANTEDLARILGLSLRGIHKLYGRYDLYSIEVTKRIEGGYELKFPGGQITPMKWVTSRAISGKRGTRSSALRKGPGTRI